MLVTDRGSCLLDKLSLANVAQFLLPLVLIVLGTTLCAQAVTIQLLDGRSGRPVAATCVFVRAENDPRSWIPLLTDKDGIALLRLTDDNDNFEKECGSHSAIKAVVKYGDSLLLGVDHYVICQPHTPNYSWGTIQNISTKQLVRQGFVTPNTCGKPAVSPKPGQLVIFIRPFSFWERLWGSMRE